MPPSRRRPLFVLNGNREKRPDRRSDEKTRGLRTCGGGLVGGEGGLRCCMETRVSSFGNQRPRSRGGGDAERSERVGGGGSKRGETAGSSRGEGSESHSLQKPDHDGEKRWLKLPKKARVGRRKRGPLTWSTPALRPPRREKVAKKARSPPKKGERREATSLPFLKKKKKSY